MKEYVTCTATGDSDLPVRNGFGFVVEEALWDAFLPKALPAPGRKKKGHRGQVRRVWRSWAPPLSLGQMLSTCPDLLPDSIIKELNRPKTRYPLSLMRSGNHRGRAGGTGGGAFVSFPGNPPPPPSARFTGPGSRPGRRWCRVQRPRTGPSSRQTWKLWPIWPPWPKPA